MSYGKVNDAFWESARIDGLSDQAALLGLFLITGPHRNAIGCFRLGMGAITDHPRFKKWGIEGVSHALSELLRMGFIVRDETTGWTFITNALKHDPIKGAKAAIHALSLADRVPRDTAVYRELKQRLEPQLLTEERALKGKEGWPMPTPSDTPCHTPSDTPSKGDAIPQPSPLPIPIPEPPPSKRDEGKPPARQVADWFLQLRSELWPDDPGFPSDIHTQTGIAQAWLDGGGWLELVKELVDEQMRKLAATSRNAPTNLNAFKRSIPAAIQKARQHAKDQGAYVPAEKVTPEGMQASRDGYVSLFKHGRPWNRALGPAPGEPGCLCSPEVLRKHGYEVVA
jgi:hypothetical protein